MTSIEEREQRVHELPLEARLQAFAALRRELWLREAIRTEKVAGKRLPGVGALQLMNQVARLFVVLVIVSAGIWIVLQLTLG